MKPQALLSLTLSSFLLASCNGLNLVGNEMVYLSRSPKADAYYHFIQAERLRHKIVDLSFEEPSQEVRKRLETLLREAEREYGLAKENDPRSSTILEQHGRLLLQAGQEGRGTALLEQAVALDPKKGQTVYPSLGSFFFVRGRYEAATRYYERALPYYASAPPGRAALQVSLGISYHHLGRHPAALRHLEQATTVSLPLRLHLSAEFFKATSYYFLHDFGRSLAALENVERLFKGLTFQQVKEQGLIPLLELIEQTNLRQKLHDAQQKNPRP